MITVIDKDKDKDKDKDSDVEDFELINCNRAGISYGELKQLHNVSMLALSNVTKIIPYLSLSTSSSSVSPRILYSSKDVLISVTNNNWIIPYNQYKEACKICKYFGHSVKNCPNLKSQYRWGNYCLRCWKPRHNISECKNEPEVVPFNEEFRSPEEIVNFLIYK
ncbi:hypothetical protein RclHR1_16210002 [Rhizophagus clarus]|uniref:CCHC-type domain-containing protein n=1 Tax=Rhizophagus clarus TaxID=94130 RepID=A0A2Z6QH72_9GLOM|nr:hypothetical protein RclHR1_16210002 [Rhizophagus clarus]